MSYTALPSLASCLTTSGDRWLYGQPKRAELVRALDNPGHPILLDLRRNLLKWQSLTGPQVALVCKILARIEAGPSSSEVKVDAPGEGRHTFTGRIASMRTESNVYNGHVSVTTKCKLVIETPEGNWGAWGSIPSNLADQAEVGDLLTIKATIKASGNDRSFVWFSRPSNGSLTKRASDEQATG